MRQARVPRRTQLERRRGSSSQRVGGWAMERAATDRQWLAPRLARPLARCMCRGWTGPGASSPARTRLESSRSCGMISSSGAEEEIVDIAFLRATAVVASGFGVRSVGSRRRTWTQIRQLCVAHPVQRRSRSSSLARFNSIPTRPIGDFPEYCDRSGVEGKQIVFNSGPRVVPPGTRVAGPTPECRP